MANLVGYSACLRVLDRGCGHRGQFVCQSCASDIAREYRRVLFASGPIEDRIPEDHQLEGAIQNADRPDFNH